jgi:phospholipid transport system substrate-binding protein
MKKLFNIIIGFTFYFTNINSAFSISPDVFIQSTVNRASQLLSKNISKDEKMSQLSLIAKETVDIRGIGFYSLGSARKNLNENQKKNLFRFI